MDSRIGPCESGVNLNGGTIGLRRSTRGGLGKADGQRRLNARRITPTGSKRRGWRRLYARSMLLAAGLSQQPRSGPRDLGLVGRGDRSPREMFTRPVRRFSGRLA